MKWKCKQSGTIIDLPDAEEKRMLKHQGYEKVVEEKKPEPKQVKTKKE